MGKRANKRQKTEKTLSKAVRPLGAPGAVSLLDDASKDDEERRLESMLFGTKYVPAPNEHVLLLSDDEDEEATGGDAEFQTVLDTDVSSTPSPWVLRLIMRIVILHRRCRCRCSRLSSRYHF